MPKSERNPGQKLGSPGNFKVWVPGKISPDPSQEPEERHLQLVTSQPRALHCNFCPTRPPPSELCGGPRRRRSPARGPRGGRHLEACARPPSLRAREAEGRSASPHAGPWAVSAPGSRRSPASSPYLTRPPPPPARSQPSGSEEVEDAIRDRETAGQGRGGPEVARTSTRRAREKLSPLPAPPRPPCFRRGGRDGTERRRGHTAQSASFPRSGPPPCPEPRAGPGPQVLQLRLRGQPPHLRPKIPQDLEPAEANRESERPPRIRPKCPAGI